MKAEKNGCRELIETFTENLQNNLDIYVDDPNTEYEYKWVTKEGACYKYIDRIETNGKLSEEENNVAQVTDSDYVIIKTYEGKEVKKVSIVLSYAMYGLFAYTLLNCKNKELFPAFAQNTKGSLDDFVSDREDPSFSICPVSKQRQISKKRTI